MMLNKRPGPEEPVLTAADRDTPVFQKLLAHYRARLDSLRLSNDKPQGDDETALLRGKIAEVKRFIGMDSDAPPPVEFERDTGSRRRE